MVKFGSHVTTEEAQCLWFIKWTFADDVPVPEIFGWQADEENLVFLYMEFIQRPTLQDCWDGLDGLEKESLREHLCQIVNRLRQLEQDPSDQYIGVPQAQIKNELNLCLVTLLQAP